MRRIEDIKRIPKKVDSRQEIVDSFCDEIKKTNPEDEGSTKDGEGLQEENEKSENRQPVKNLGGKIVGVILIIAVLGGFFGFAMIRAKTKIESQTGNIKSDLDGFQTAVSKKDFLVLVFKVTVLVNKKTQARCLREELLFWR